MPKTQSEDDKKHGDKMAPLIDRTTGSSGGKRKGAGRDDPAELQDDDDEDLENDNADSGRDVPPEIKPVR
jgi:hypothetical protein